MALLPNINVGSSPNDGTGSSLRDAFIIVNENFQLIEAFFPNSSVANLVANIESTGTSVFNIANANVLNVNTVSSFTTTDITISNNLSVTNTGTFSTIDVDTLNANTISNLTISGNITANITSTANSSFNITSHSGAATFDDTVFIGTTLTVDTIDANVGDIAAFDSNLVNANNIIVADTATINNLNANITSITGDLNTSNISVQGSFNQFGVDSIVIFGGNIKANAKFSTNTFTITSDANLEIDHTRAQTIIANLTAGNITVTLPNADVQYNDGLYYTFICYDEGGNSNRTLTVNVQPGAANIWTSANTQNTFINVSAELGTNSVEMKTNEVYWFTF